MKTLRDVLLLRCSVDKGRRDEVHIGRETEYADTLRNDPGSIVEFSFFAGVTGPFGAPHAGIITTRRYEGRDDRNTELTYLAQELLDATSVADLVKKIELCGYPVEDASVDGLSKAVPELPKE